MWIKLERGNDWGVEYFAPKGTALNSHGSSDQKREMLFSHDHKLAIKWPDGTECWVTVFLKRFDAEVYDCGHRSSVSYHLAGFNHDIHGITQWFPLDAVEIWKIKE